MHGCGWLGKPPTMSQRGRQRWLLLPGFGLVWLAGAQGTDPAPPQQRPTSICTNTDTWAPVRLIAISSEGRRQISAVASGVSAA